MFLCGHSGGVVVAGYPLASDEQRTEGEHHHQSEVGPHGCQPMSDRRERVGVTLCACVAAAASERISIDPGVQATPVMVQRRCTDDTVIVAAG